MIIATLFDESSDYSTLLVVALGLLQVGIVIRVLMRRLPVGESLSWVLVAAGFPVAGPLLYLMFGELRLGSRRAARFSALFAPARVWVDELDYARGEPSSSSGGKAFSQLVERSLGLPPFAGGKITLLPSWQESFDAIIQDINAAQESCFLEFYIWNSGGRAEEVADALAAAAARGVQCQMLLDAIGSRPFLRSAGVKKLRDAGIEVVAALPGGIFRMLFVRFDLRLHRKVVVIDGRVAYTGSMNLVDPRYFKQGSGVGQWIDAMARIEGPPVTAMAITFLADWSVEQGTPFEELKANNQIDAPTAGEDVLQAIPSGPAYGSHAIERAIVTACYSAQAELILTTPYFVPDEPLQSALVSAAMRGVKVVLVTPEKVDSLLVRFASRAFFSELLAAGVEIRQFHGGLLHTKSVTVDEDWCLFGSLNLDPRSLHLNFELTLAVYDQGFTQELRALQHSYIAESSPLTEEDMGRRGTSQLVAENLARLLAPLL